MVHGIYLDLKRAFDRCPFKLLIIRLKKAGITGKLLRYIYNFLRNRTFRVIANGSISEGRPVLSGTPQGSGLSPVIFAVFIQSLAERLDTWIGELEKMGSEKVGGAKDISHRIFYSMYADDIKMMAAIGDEEDMDIMQEVMELVYRWADENGMIFSSGKTKCIKIGREGVIGQYTGADGEELEWEESLRDLGVIIGNDGTMAPNIEEVIRKVQKTSYWIVRSFQNRTPNFWRFMWRTYISPLYEYCGPLYYPSTYGAIDALESGMRSFMKQIPMLHDVHMWDKLKIMNLSSVQRRNERYHIIAYWKLVNGYMYGSEKFQVKESRKGSVAVYPHCPRGADNWVKNLRLNSFHYKGCRLYNSTPRWVRDIKGGSVESFKKTLNKYLAHVPDQPRDVSGNNYPKAYDTIAQTPSNSLIYWGALLREIRPGWGW